MSRERTFFLRLLNRVCEQWLRVEIFHGCETTDFNKRANAITFDETTTVYAKVEFKEKKQCAEHGQDSVFSYRIASAISAHPPWLPPICWAEGLASLRLEDLSWS